MDEKTWVDKILKELPRRLQAARSLKGASLADVEARLKIHFSTIGNYENGRRLPGLKNLLRLCFFYGVTPNWLFGLDEGWAEALPNHIKESLADPEFLDWLEIVFKLRQRGVPLTAAQGMAESMAEAVEKVMQALREAEDAVVRTMQGKP